MLDKYQNLKDEFDSADRSFSEELSKVKNAVKEIQENTQNVLTSLNNLDKELSDIDKEFYCKTGIANPKDMLFLWFGVALQCTRWILIPSIDEDTFTPTTDDRKPSQTEGRKDKTGTGKQIDTKYNKENPYPDNKEIMLLPVPFDAMKGTEDIVIPGVTEYGKQIYSKNHHSATLGHDPIIGQVVGTMNILTRSITFHDTLATTRKVVILHGRTQEVIKDPYGIPFMIDDAISSLTIDKERLFTALKKENLHLLSDKFTRTGLPIPFLNARTQQRLLEMKWNSKELEDVFDGSTGIAKNAVIAALINSVIRFLHELMYDNSKDGDEKLYKVRTERVVSISNIVAESINIGVVAAGTIVGVVTENPELIKKSVSHIDIGGVSVAIHEVARSQKLQETIRREFLEQKLDERLVGKDYSFV